MTVGGLLETRDRTFYTLGTKENEMLLRKASAVALLWPMMSVLAWCDEEPPRPGGLTIDNASQEYMNAHLTMLRHLKGTYPQER